MRTRLAAILGLAALAGTFPAFAQPAPKGAPQRFVPDANLTRAAVPDQFKWKLDALFASDAEFEKGLAQAAEMRTRLAAFKGRLSDPAALRDALKVYFEARLLTNKLSLYGNLRFVGEGSNTSLQKLRDQGLGALDALMSTASFIRQEVLALPDQTLAKAWAMTPALPGYQRYVDEIRRRRTRVLGAEAERVLSLAGDNLWAEIDLNEIPSDHEKAHAALLTDLVLPRIRDEKGAEVQLTLSNYGRYRASADRGVRKAAVEGLLSALRQYQHALAATYAGQVREDVFMARARGYDSALAAYLDKDEVDPAVYRNLVTAIHDNLKPLHDYVSLRKRLMGLPDLHLYDLYTPLVPSVRMEFPYPEAERILPEALAPLGPEYVSTLKQGLDLKNGWIDLYPNKDKESGAFSSSVYGVHPFVKMNYQEDYDDLSTLAHELGHALHTSLSGANQPYPTANYVMFIAEIASTVNEKLLSDYMLAKVARTDDERLFLLNERLESLRTTIFRQALFAEFELIAHTRLEQGEPLTADALNDTYRKLVAQYYGPDLTLDENDAVEWAYIPHFFYKYYVYSYATGLSSGVALADLIGTGDPAKRDAYLGMLKGGSSKPPLELLKGAGVDLTRPDAIVAASRLMAETIHEMETILARRAKK